MRKFSLALLAMIMVSAMAFAAPIGTEWTLEAEASATFGVNLDGLATTSLGTDDGPTTGFALSNDINLEVEFIEEQTQEFGEGEMYGYIEIEDFEIIMEADGVEGTAPVLTGTNGEITAKVMLGPAYIVIATAENDVNSAELGLNVDETILGAATNVTMPDYLSDADDGNSVALGINAGPSNIEFVLASTGTTQTDGTNSDDWSDNPWNNYTGAILTETTVADLTISVDLAAQLRGHGPKAADTNDTESQGDFGDDGFIGLGVEYEMPLDDFMTLVPYLGLDLDNDATNDEMDYELIAGANIEWGADDLEVFDEVSDETQAGVGIEIGYYVNESASDDALVWVRLGAAEEGGDDGFLPVVGGAAIVEYITAGSDVSIWSFGLQLDADLGEISPFFGLMMADAEDLSGNDAGMTMNVGTDINIIPATTFTIEYKSGDLNADGDGVYDTNQFSYNAAVGEATSKSGTFTIKTTVEY